MALPSYKASGALASGAAAITPAYPTAGNAPVADDIAILVVESENQAITLSTPAGFVEIPNSPQSAGAAGTGHRCAVFWKRCVGGDTNPTVADPGDHATAAIHLFSGCETTGDPWDVIGAGNDGGVSDTTGTIPGGVTTGPDRLIVLICGSSNNATSTTHFSAWADGSLANIVEHFDATSTIGLGGGHGMATGEKAVAGAYGTSTVTLSAASLKSGFSIALKPLGITNKSGTDAGAGADVSADTATYAGADSAAGSDASILQQIEDKAAADSGSGADASAEVALYTATDAAAGSEASAVAAAAIGTDAGAGVDASAAGMAEQSADGGAGDDSATETATNVRADAGAGDDASAQEATYVRTDSGSGADAGTQAVAPELIIDDDSGAGADVAIVAASVTAGEAGFGSDAALLTVALTSSDSGSGAEAETIERLILGSDSGFGAELAAIFAGIVATDSGVGADTARLVGGTFVAMVRQRLASALGVASHPGDSAPFTFEPGKLYVWEDDDRPARRDAPRRDFVLRVVYVVDDLGERAAGERERAVTVAIDAARDTMLDTIATTYEADLWEYAIATVEPRFVRGFGVRGVGLRITGYRIV